MTRPHFSDADRRSRLARRHLLLPSARVERVAAVCDALVGLHSSDPVTVYLSAAVRLDDPSIGLIDDALYGRREVVRQHAMRRTLWVFTPEVARAAHASSTVALVGPMRRSLCRLLIANGITDDPDRWLDQAVAMIADTLADLGQATALQIGEALPDLRTRLAVPPDNPSGATIAAHTRVLNLMGFMGIAVRARPVGTWASGQYRWTLADRWPGGPIPQDDSTTAAATIVDRYLRAFGPASMVDICWWTGWSKRVTVKRDRGSRAVRPSTVTTVNSGLAQGDAAHDPEPEPWVASPAESRPDRDGLETAPVVPAPTSTRPHCSTGTEMPGQRSGRTVEWSAAGPRPARVRSPIGCSNRCRPTHESLLNDEIERLRSFVGDTRFTIRFPSPLSKELSR